MVTQDFKVYKNVDIENALSMGTNLVQKQINMELLFWLIFSGELSTVFVENFSSDKLQNTEKRTTTMALAQLLLQDKVDSIYHINLGQRLV